MLPVSALMRWLRWKPVAIFWSSVALGSRSPASCSTVNRSNGMLRLKALMTQSRQGHISLRGVGLVAVSVGIAGGVEPVDGHAFAVARRGQQAVHRLLVGVRGGVREEGIEFGEGGRQTGEVEADAPQQAGAAGFRRRREAFAFQAREDEAVDGIAYPTPVPDGGFRRTHRWRETPVALPFRALFDPGAKRGHFLFGEWLPVGIGRRHAAGGVFRSYPFEDLAGRYIAGNDRGAGTARFLGAILGVEPQTGLPLGFVGTVAGETAVRENRADVAGEVHRRRGRQVDHQEGARQ